MSDFTEIKEKLRDCDNIRYYIISYGTNLEECTAHDGRIDMGILLDIIEKKDEAINELLANIELSHPEEYKSYRELPSVDKAIKLTEE